MATLAKGLVAAGVGRLVVAGGETSGAVVGALDVTALRIGPEIDPGVPWTASVGAKPLLLALKSGNFGAPDFFTKAFAQAMSSEAKSREAICALGAKLAARGLCPGTSGNISVRIADGWLMTPTNSSLGELDPAQLSKLDTQRQACRRRSADQGSAAASLGLRRAAQGRRDRASPLHARRGDLLPRSVVPPQQGDDPAADHALLRDAGRQAAAGALLQAGRSQARRCDPRLRQGPSRRAAGQPRPGRRRHVAVGRLRLDRGARGDRQAPSAAAGPQGAPAVRLRRSARSRKRFRRDCASSRRQPWLSSRAQRGIMRSLAA